ncbi:MAG: GNAT family N-acetyltransferase [Candidatus Rokubacteria bacterium]|nr:GNAT family N-acetyltransferase [Candidatus Rokubacteria bacterium]
MAEELVVPAEAGDLPALAALMAASPLLRRYGTTREAALAALKRAHRAGDLLLVGRPPGGLPVGLAWVIGSRILTGAAYLRLLLVAEGHRRSGVGARLLTEAERRAREWANHLVLLATTDNTGARRFYERLGYRHVGDLPSFAVPGLDEALYQKALRPHADRLPV